VVRSDRHSGVFLSECDGNAVAALVTSR
jgi:hypothetical protein